MNPELEAEAAQVLLEAGWPLDDVLAVLRPVERGSIRTELVPTTLEAFVIDFAEFALPR